MRISDWSSDVCSSDLIAVVIIARRAPESEHRILFLRFEDVAAYEVGVFVGLEVAEANDGGVRVIGTCELGDTASEDIDELVGRMRVSACEFPEIGRAHACTSVTNAPLVCRLLLDKTNTTL